MKSILKRVPGLAAGAVLALGVVGCSNGSKDFVLIPAGTFQMELLKVKSRKTVL